MNPSPQTILSPRQSPLDDLNSRLSTLKATLAQQTQKLQVATQAKSQAESALQSAKATLTSATQKAQAAKAALDTASTNLDTAKSALSTAQQAFDTADAALTQQTEITESAQEDLDAAQANLTAATSNLQTAQQAYDAAAQLLTNKLNLQSSSNSALASAQATLQQALNTFNTERAASQAAQQAIQTAQAAYDNSQIPNPLYVPPGFTTQPTSYQIPDNNFMTGTPWIGDGSGSQGQPEIHPGHIHFSYIGTEVYQDILISPRAIANYTFTVGVWNQDQNSVNRGPVADTYGLRIYFYDADNNLIHQGSANSSEVHSWRDFVLQGDTGTTIPVSKVRISIYGIDNGYWSGTYGPAMNNVRLTLGWITGTIQPPTQTGTINVNINEGGESTYTAPNGGTFISSNLRYEAIDDATCGADVTPSNLGSNTITLAADNSLWGDPCGGWYKRLVGTLTYSYAQPQYIKDPALLQNIQAAEDAYNNVYRPAEIAAYVTYLNALNAYSTINQQNTQVDEQVASATQQFETAQAALEAAEDVSDSATVAEAQAELVLVQETEELTSTQVAFSSAQSALAAATASLSSATSTQAQAESAAAQATTEVTSTQTQVQSAEQTVQAASSGATSAQEDIAKTSTQIAAVELEIKNLPPEPTPTPTPTPTPKPEEPEEEEKIELPPLEDLTKVNFEEIVATDLTAAQAEQIKEAALETFKTAEQGSPEYQAALTALFVAAQQDDIVVDEALAAIPGVGAAVVALADAVNFLGNAGADMSPQVREESEKIVVTAVVAVQAAVSAVAATTSAATMTRR
jgi:hypothetical protein